MLNNNFLAHLSCKRAFSDVVESAIVIFSQGKPPAAHFLSQVLCKEYVDVIEFLLQCLPCPPNPAQLLCLRVYGSELAAPNMRLSQSYWL